MIKVVAKCTIAPENKDSAMAVLEELVSTTVQEDGCINYNFCADVKGNGEYAILETWETQEALDVHSASEHFGRLVPQLAALAAGEIEITAYSVVL